MRASDSTISQIPSLGSRLTSASYSASRDRFVISAPVAGKVLRVELEPGDPVVARETVVATFDPAAPVALDARSRAEAEAGVRTARARLDIVIQPGGARTLGHGNRIGREA